MEKPTTLEKLEVCRNLNVVPAVGQIRTEGSCGARLAGKKSLFFRSKMTAGLQLLCTHDSEDSKNDRWKRGED